MATPGLDKPDGPDFVDDHSAISDPVETSSRDLIWCFKCDRRTCRCPKIPDHYAHAGRRRKRITEDLFRCKMPLVLKGEKIPCNALVWRQADKMREHMLDHMTESELELLSEADLLTRYKDAARIAQEGIPDDDDH